MKRSAKNKILIIFLGLLLLGILFYPRLTAKPVKNVQTNWTYTNQFPTSGLSANLGKTNSSARIEFIKSGSTLNMEVPLKNSTLKKEADSITYQDQTTKIIYRPIPNGVKEELILLSPPASNQFPITLTLDNLVPKHGFGNRLLFYDQNNNYVYHFDTLSAKDANGAETKALKYKIYPTDSANTYRLIVEIDPEWLNDPKRVYPITIDPTVVNKPEDAKPEIVEKRTSRSKTYQDTNGRLLKKITLQPLHYQDKDNHWVDIDNGIETDSGNFDYKNTKNIFQSRFKQTVSGDFLNFGISDTSITYRLKNNPSIGKVHDLPANISANTITYPEIYEGIDLKYTLYPTQLLEEYIVKNSATASKINELGKIVTLKNLIYEEKPNGSIIFYNKNGQKQPLFYLPQPVMYETGYNSQSGSQESNFGLHYKITQEKSNISLVKVIDESGKTWLKDPQRKYPVAIDDTHTYIVNDVDAQAYGSATTTNGGFNGSETEFSPAQYTNISVDDNNYTSYETTSVGYYPYHRLLFTINEAINDITQVGVTWKGYGYRGLDCTNYGASLFAKESGTWTLKTTGTSSSKETLSAQYLSNFANIISGGSMEVGAQQTLPNVKFCNSTIFSYYAEVLVTYNAASPTSTPTPSPTPTSPPAPGIRLQGVKLSGVGIGSGPMPTRAWSCGSSLTINHTTAGGVAPVDKTVTYGTISTDIAGTGSKCWITQNLGATDQASSATDSDEASGGWYWQFNRKQGYKYDSSRTPSTSWDTTNDNTYTGWDPAKDPCTLELGASWRLPTSTEWTNANGSPQNWANYTDTYNSVLKLHTAGYLNAPAGNLINRGNYGDFWSSTQSSATNGQNLHISIGSSIMNAYGKAAALSLRCLKD